MTIQYALELAGTGFFSISGAIVATRRSSSDWFGVTFISFITAIGGGSLRDILLGSYPLVWVRDINFMYAVMAGVIFTRIFYGFFLRLRKMMFLFDTAGVAMFTIIGTEKALHFGVNPMIAAIMGMFSAVMGGVLRDILTNEIPILFKKELYASLCLGGAVFYLALDYLGCERNLDFILSILFIMLIRIIAVRYDLSFPEFKRVKGDGIERL